MVAPLRRTLYEARLQFRGHPRRAPCAAVSFSRRRAMAEIVLNVELRESTGTGNARAVRREGKVPGVLYGGPRGPAAIAVEAIAFKKAPYTGKLLRPLVTLKYGAETQPGRTKAGPCHPATD